MSSTQQQQQQQVPQQQNAAGFATVKAVPTGDTVVVMGRPVNGPPPELQLSLSGVASPRLARGPSGADEPFAWEAREFLRKLVLGKAVRFRQENASKGGRAYGSLWLPGANGGPPESVAMLAVRAGWCVVQRGEEGSSELAAAEAEAREARRGSHTADNAVRQAAVRSVTWSMDATTLAEKYATARAIVEYVKDGSNMRCMIIPDFCVVNVSLAGVRCGRVNRPPAQSDEKEETAATPPAEPFAEEAKFFVESRLLHREVDIRVASIDRFGNALCTVKHTNGVIAVELVKQGLGRVSEPGLTGVPPTEAAQLRDAEKQAKKDKVRLWRGYEAPKVAGVDETDFEAVVVEAISGDQISVQKWGDETGAEIRLALSSVRAPRLANARAGRSGEPWAAEAREHVRKLAAGKRCRVKVEYARDIPMGGGTDDVQTRVFARVTLAGGPKAPTSDANDAPTRDLAELLLGAGLVALVPPRTSDERAERYDELAAAEKRAKAKKLGSHSGKAAPAPEKIIDLAGDAKRARAFLPYLKRQKTHKALVEFVFTGSRIKLRFAGENCAVVFSLAACRSPAPASAAKTESETGGDAAKAYGRRVLLQRYVEAAVDDMDRNGVALGSLTLLDKHGTTPETSASYETRLLSRGLARLDRRRLDQQLPSSELGLKYKQWSDIEEKARQRRIGLWSDEANVRDFVEASAAPAQSDAVVEERRWPAQIAEIVDGTTFFVHEVASGDNTSRFEAVSTRMRAFRPPSALDEAGAKKTFRRGVVVAALFGEGEWCRAKILEAGRTFKLRYVDYGNLEADVRLDRLRPLDPGLAALPPAAVECALAYVAVASLDDEPGEQAARTLHDLAWDQPLQVCEHAPFAGDSAKRRVVLRLQRDDDDAQSINERLVNLGLARVPRAAKRDAKLTDLGPKLLDSLVELEQQARSRRSGLWRFGDVDWSDEDN